MNWDDLQFVLAVADGGSLAGAGRSLDIVLSTALRRLDALEASLGTRLFERHRKGYVPTEAGELLIREARTLAQRIDHVTRQLLGRDLHMKGSIRFTTAFGTMFHLLDRALGEFAHAHPRIAVDVLETGAMLDLSQRQADVALRFTANAADHLVGRRLGTVHYRVYARRGDPALPQTTQALERLQDTPRWIEFGRPGSPNRCSQWIQRRVPQDHVRMHVDSFGSVVSLLRAGCGIGLLPSYVAAGEESLVAVSDAIDELATPAWILTHPDLRRTARIKAFMRFLGDAVEQRLRTAEHP